ncbi:MAG: phosphoglycerate dehydrogenase [Nitrospirae bacterium]|nr:phosphoglycerate dehydrogenase [Nitrospirota bacterium]
MRVLVSDSLSEKGVEILKNSGLSVDVNTKLSKEDLLKVIGDYDGLVVRSATKVTAEVLNAAKNLKVVGRAGAGLDNIDLPASTKKGVVVMNTPGGNTVTTAEHAISMLLAMLRMIPQATASLKNGKWEKSKFTGTEFYNKTLGIVGMGRVGSHAAKLGQGLMMNVLAYDPYLSPENAQKMGVELVTLQDIYRRSDFITIHSPLTPETKNLINAEAISQMKDGVMMVNCARGGIVDENALYEALKSKKIAAAAFDVFVQEPVDPKHPLLTLDNFISTPHLGASTTEAQENVALAIAEQIVDYLTKGVIRNAANFPSVSPDVLPRLQPYITLAEKLGAFHASICEGGIEKVSIEYRGKVAELNIAPLTIAAVKGLLTPILEDTVNFVNASSIAQERGITIEESINKDAGDYISLINITVTTNSGTNTAKGALFSRRDPRIIELNGFPLEVVPEGYMLVLTNVDKPGVVGNTGTLLGQHNINIARMQFGRDVPGGKVVSVISIDTPVSEELLDNIRKLPNVLSVKQIKL